MKKILILLFALSMLSVTGCMTYDRSKVKELDKYIFEVEEYSSLDHDCADAFYARSNDNWGGGCSAVSKMVDGHRLVGRNMDQSISHKCAYIIRTNAGKYRTIGIVYTHRDYSPDYAEVVSKGLSDEFYRTLPFMCDDVLNSAGLHIEINMRHGEYWPNGEDKFACSGTNPESSERVYMFELPRYIGENCATVAEAKEYVSTLNVYSQNHYWNYCFIISDSEGHSSLLEFAFNEVHWLDEEALESYEWLKVYHPKAVAQANFYLNKLAWYVQDIKTGEGRYIALQKGIDSVDSRRDMYDLMRRVQYSNFYLDYDECKNNYFDPRSENIGEVPWAQYELIMHPEFEETARKIINEMNAEVRKLTREEKQDINKYWESIFTEVVDVDAREIFVRMYENEDQLYLISFDGTTRLNSIDDWKK
ncbi:MAG: hypothetical protein MJ215_05275 [Spirochaetia bacterium]|nr:hypothetical protein [Spirochaetia bacterium]